jgi:hypothetical protein
MIYFCFISSTLYRTRAELARTLQAYIQVRSNADYYVARFFGNIYWRA